MIQALAVFIVVLLGTAIGWLCRLMPVRPAAQDLAAAAVAAIVGYLGMVIVTLLIVLWWLPAPGSGGLGAVSTGFFEFELVIVPAVLLLAFAARSVLLRPGMNVPRVLRTHSAVFIGAGSALLAALWAARGLIVSD